MIRRIILFLGILFVGFFAYRRYDKVAADQLLSKIKNFSFSKQDTYTTTIYDANGSGRVVVTSGSSWLLEKLSDTMSDKSSSSETNEQIVEQILNEDRLQEGVIVPWISGKVIIQTGKADTISAVPKSPAKASTNTTTKTTLSQEDERQAEEFSQMFSD